MKRERLGIQVAVVFGLSLLLYVIAFGWIEYRRHFKGPWQLNFATDSAGAPTLSVNQPALKIVDVRFVFDGIKLTNTNLPQLIRFDVSATNVPFGKVIYFDTTFLPGAVTLELFGHKLEFLPRTIVVDTNEVPWRNGQTISLPKPPE